MTSEHAEHSYKFVSTGSDIDYVRIVKEAPRGTKFIAVQLRDRKNGRPFGWILYVHNSILENPDFEQKILAGESISKDWGVNRLHDADTGKDFDFYSYRVIGGDGKFPGIIKQEVEKLRRISNPKDTETTVSYI